jgi:hypothetical protein
MTITLSPTLTRIDLTSWAAWKSAFSKRIGAKHRYSDEDGFYFIWFYDDHEVYTFTMWQGTVPDGVISGGYTQQQNDADKADFEAKYKSTSNQPISTQTVDGRVRIANEKTDGDRVNFFSCDYTDATTWYQQSTYVSAEVATDGGAHTVYTLAHSPVVDTYHGRLTGEDTLVDAQGHDYRVHVTVTPQGGSPATKVEQDPHFGTGGDFTVNYDTGAITFLSALAATDQVNVTYHWVNLAPANGTASRFTVAPATGKKLCLEIAECQFSTDVEPNDSVVFEVWGIADFFLTSGQMSAYGIPYGIGYKIRLQRVAYKALSDFQNDAFRSYPAYAAMGSPSNWRAQQQPVTVFDWDYLTSIILLSSKGMEIRVFLEHDSAFGGWMATAAFYCKSEPEL